MKNWRKNFFDENYIDFYKNILTPARTAEEVEFLVSVFDADTELILDIPCGYGRHTIELAKRGYWVHGVDVHDSQLDIARQSAIGIPCVSFEKADMREFRGHAYDAVINMFTSFGYFSRKEDAEVLGNLSKSIRSGGLVVIDVRNSVRLRNEMEEQGWKTERITASSHESEEFDPRTSVLTMHYTRFGKTKSGCLNIYTPDEYMEGLRQNGCVVRKLYGNYKGEEYDPESSWRLIVVAQRL